MTTIPPHFCLLLITVDAVLAVAADAADVLHALWSRRVLQAENGDLDCTVHAGDKA